MYKPLFTGLLSVFLTTPLLANTQQNELQSAIKAKLEQVAQQSFFRNGECADQSLKARLANETIQRIKSLALTDGQLKMVLSYLSYKTYNKCMGDLPVKGVALIELANDEKVEHPKLSSKNFTVLAVEEAKYELAYLQLSAGLRQKIEQITELNTLFNAGIAYQQMTKSLLK